MTPAGRSPVVTPAISEAHALSGDRSVHASIRYRTSVPSDCPGIVPAQASRYAHASVSQVTPVRASSTAAPVVATPCDPAGSPPSVV